jgi:very-short-patch-repair endonuclease
VKLRVWFNSDVYSVGDRSIARFACSQHGVFTKEHADRAGLTAEQRKQRIETGQWVVLHEVVYRLSGTPATWRGELLAACWAGGFRAVASHRSAAALWGLAGGRQELQEITCPRWRRARHEHLIVHESKALDPVDTTFVGGIPVTTAERTLLDLGAVCGARTVEMALDRAEHRGLVNVESVRRMLTRLARRGRPGVRKLRRILESRQPGQRAPESEMETMLIQILRDHGFPDGIPQYEIRVRGKFIARVDLGFPEQRVAVEYDSDEWHGARGVNERDASRRRQLRRYGWETVTATRADVLNGAPETRGALRAALRHPRFGVAQG